VEHWLFGFGVIAGPASTAARLSFGAARWHGTLVRGMPGPSTLLGPEGTAVSWARNLYEDRWLPRLIAAQSRDRPYLENCTVDASIICSCQANKGTR
jgi:hypothetical protein